MNTLNIQAALLASDGGSARVRIVGGSALDLATLTSLAREVIAVNTGLPADDWEIAGIETEPGDTGYVFLDLHPRPATPAPVPAAAS